MAKESQKELIESSIKSVLESLGEDPSREGLKKTPERYAKALEFLTSGYNQDAEKILKSAMFTEKYSEMVVVRDIEVFSLCEHHMLPFFGKAHIAYIPNGKIVGLSKLPRILNVFARRLQVQERLTDQIAGCLFETLHAEGVGVVMECYHLCMMMRGVEKQGAFTTTSSMLGSFRDDASTRQEFLSLLKRPRP